MIGEVLKRTWTWDWDFGFNVCVAPRLLDWCPEFRSWSEGRSEFGRVSLRVGARNLVDIRTED